MPKAEEKRVFTNWKKINGKYLITNDFGYFEFLSPDIFNKYITNKKIPNTILKKLQESQFIRNSLDFEGLSLRYNRYYFSRSSPKLHILVITNKCNENCVYCQTATSRKNATKNSEMNIKTAKKCIDFILDNVPGQNKELTIEFQGGEPLLNWKVLKEAISYIRKKEKNNGLEIMISLVTNMSLMDKAKADFLLKNRISLCTSLDGPKNLHDINRHYSNGSSYKKTTQWISFFNEKYKKQDAKKDAKVLPVYQISALLTVTKNSLKYPKEIIDEYIANEINSVFLRPLSKLGQSAIIWDKIGYEPDDFIKFYRKAFDYILYLNLNKKAKIKEQTAIIMLNKILKFNNSNFADLCSPCGAGTMQIVYETNGDIYTCDEARMFEEGKKQLFKVGNIFKDKFAAIIDHPSIKACCLTSNLESQHKCFRCVYKPYCGTCPVLNYAIQNNIHGNLISNFYCKIKEGIFNIIFEKLQNKKFVSLFERWLNENNSIR